MVNSSENTQVGEEQQQQESGKSQLRVEDHRLLTGRGLFVDDLNVKGQAYMGLVISPFAHAKILKIDFSKVKSSPEFIAALTGEDLIKEGVAAVAQNPWPPQRRAKRYHLAVGTTKFVGEPVAAILVKSKSSLEDLLEQVEVEYDSLPVVTTIEESKQRKALVYDDWADNLSQENEEQYGDADKAISSAAYVVTVKEGIKRQEAAPIEPHATLVSYDKNDDSYEVYATVQSVHGLQGLLSTELKIPRQKLHIRVMDVGGGFGSKGGPSYPWPFLACLFAKKTGLPVKWAATRTEEFLEAAAGRDEYCTATLACNREGRIVALKANIECDVGVSGTQTHMPSLTMWTMTGPYAVPNANLKVAAYVTNKMPIGPVRGAGAPEGCYFIERLIEVMSKKIGVDPVEFRRRNIPRPKSPGSENYADLLDTLVNSSDYGNLQTWRNKLQSDFTRNGGSRVLGGIGISLRGSNESENAEEEEGFSSAEGEGDDEEEEEGNNAWQRSGSGSGSGDSGSSSSWQRDQHRNDSSSSSGEEEQQRQSGEGGGGAASWFMTETARVVLHKNGELTIYTGSSPHGQGHETTFAQLASQELGIPIENIRLVWGDTSLIPFGVGTFGSRSAATGGSAVVDASRKLKLQLLEKASKILSVDPKSLDIERGLIVSTSHSSVLSLAIPQLFEKLGASEMSADSSFTAKSMSYSSGAHLCALALDTETGKVKISDYVVVEDCGRMINRSVVEGQLHGGIIHGVGGALLEELVYDNDGNLLTTTFMDYSIPTSTDSPDIKIFHRTTPSTVTLDGVKGVGESGTIGSYAAVINALNDAISQVKSDAQENIAPALPDVVYSAST